MPRLAPLKLVAPLGPATASGAGPASWGATAKDRAVGGSFVLAGPRSSLHGAVRQVDATRVRSDTDAAAGLAAPRVSMKPSYPFAATSAHAFRYATVLPM